MLKQNMGQPQKRLDQLKQKMKQSRQAAEVAGTNYDIILFIKIKGRNVPSAFLLATHYIYLLFCNTNLTQTRSTWNQ